MKKTKKIKGAIVVSGGITYRGTLPYFVRYRLDEAYKIYHAGLVEKIVVCGKWSYHLQKEPPLTEANAMSKYLQSLGVEKSDIILEDKSIDLISCALFLKKEILTKKQFSHLTIIGSDFQEERLEYIWKQFFGTRDSYIINLVPSKLPPDLLWQFFLYDRETFTKTKIFLGSNNASLDIYLKDKYKKIPLYKNTVTHYLPQLVFSNKLGRASGAKAHYSLAAIYRKRIDIFHKYNLDLNRKRTLKADFWSGRFLNFLGRDQNKAYYCLKFALKPKDKESFINEITISNILKKKDIAFIPTIIDQHFQKAPLWYLYKVVGGRMSGEFSKTFCFDDYFYNSFVPKMLVSHIKSYQSILIESKFLPVWDGKKYIKKVDDMYQRYKSQNLELNELNRITQAHNIVKNSIHQLNASTLYLSHNDLHPANIIISTSKKQIFFIDFEHTGLNNIAFDFSFLYLFAWNNSNFQKKLLKNYVDMLTPDQQKEFESIFPYVYTYFLLWLLRFTYIWKYRTEEKYIISARKYIESELDNIIDLDKHKQLNFYVAKVGLPQ